MIIADQTQRVPSLGSLELVGMFPRERHVSLIYIHFTGRMNT